MSDCMRWGGRHRDDGRPMTSEKNPRYAYRLAWEEKHGRLCPEGMVAHHTCENPWCVNPDHLEFITQGEHIALHGLPGDNHNAAKTHCINGHEYTPENTYTYTGRGKVERYCQTCSRETKRRYRARQRSKI